MAHKFAVFNFASVLVFALGFLGVALTPAFLCAQTTNTEAKAYPFAPMDENEMRLLLELQERRQELQKESGLLPKTKSNSTPLFQASTSTNNKDASAPVLASKREIQLYMQMKPAKAAQLMENQDDEKVGYILNQMPAPFAARIIEKMSVEKAAYFLTNPKKRQP